MGKLIIIEGGDGSGKATQTALLKERLEREGYNVRTVSFPNYDSPAAMPVKMYLAGDFGKKPSDVNPMWPAPSTLLTALRHIAKTGRNSTKRADSS